MCKTVKQLMVRCKEKGEWGVTVVHRLEKDRGFRNPQGIGEGYRGVGVRVQILLPPQTLTCGRGIGGNGGIRRGIGEVIPSIQALIFC